MKNNPVHIHSLNHTISSSKKGNTIKPYFPTKSLALADKEIDISLFVPIPIGNQSAGKFFVWGSSV